MTLYVSEAEEELLLILVVVAEPEAEAGGREMEETAAAPAPEAPPSKLCDFTADILSLTAATGARAAGVTSVGARNDAALALSWVGRLKGTAAARKVVAVAAAAAPPSSSLIQNRCSIRGGRCCFSYNTTKVATLLFY